MRLFTAHISIKAGIDWEFPSKNCAVTCCVNICRASTKEAIFFSKVKVSYHQQMATDRLLPLHFKGIALRTVFKVYHKSSAVGHSTLNIVCNGNVIESKSTVTYLGVTLDQSLSGDVMASDVLFKTSNKLKFLYRNARKFNMKTKKLLVSSLIQCNFDYTCRTCVIPLID